MTMYDDVDDDDDDDDYDDPSGSGQTMVFDRKTRN